MVKHLKARTKATILYIKDSLVLWSNNKKIKILINKSINDKLSQDESDIVNALIKHARPVRRITRNNKEVHCLPLLTEITFGQYLRAREQANKGDIRQMVKEYSGFDLNIIGELIVASAWVVAQLRLAESVELEKLGGGGDGEADEDIAILNMLQVVAESYRIPTLEANDVKYEDALKALIKNKKDYDRQVEIMRRSSRAAY